MISIFDLFSIGIGPSSSHTVGPMRAARDFLLRAKSQHAIWQEAVFCQVDLYGSLALTGKGHGTDYAVLMGLTGEDPESIDPIKSRVRWQEIIKKQELCLLNEKPIPFYVNQSLVFHTTERLAYHSNGLVFTLKDPLGIPLLTQTYYSVGGGFIVREEEIHGPRPFDLLVPYPFRQAVEWMRICQDQDLSLDQLMLENEKTWRSEEMIRQRASQIVDVMMRCIDSGLQNTGILPGPLGIKRRAPGLYQKIIAKQTGGQTDRHQVHHESMDWLSVFAIAVNEENAAGSRVVTAPTNGAAGIIPAVLKYHLQFYSQDTVSDAFKYLLIAGAIGILYKEGASISAAEVGCQGEVGVACSMAAGALTALWGGTLAQIENAAEIGMEHHLGLTCDPVGGLVQIPCIERNAIGAVQAVNAARLALMGDGQHFVSLDQVIKTMRQTGLDMSVKYKETSEGGLAVAVNLPAC